MSFTENWFMPFFGVGKKMEERGRSEEEIRERFWSWCGVCFFWWRLSNLLCGRVALQQLELWAKFLVFGTSEGFQMMLLEAILKLF